MDDASESQGGGGFASRPAGSRRLARAWLWALLCGALAAAVYAPSLRGGFVWDDHDIILRNVASLDEWGDAADGFTRPVLPGGRASYYRPVLMASYVADHQRAGLDAAAFHATNLALHAVNTVVVWWLVFAFAGSLLAASLGALCFGVHPLQGQAVSLLLGRNDLLLLLPLAGALLAYRAWDSATGGRRAWLHGLLLALFATVLWTKETGLVLPAMLVAYDLLVARRPLAALRERVPLHASLAVVAAAYFAVRWQIFGYLLGGGAYGSEPLAQRLLQAVAVFGYYIWKACLPLALSATPWSNGLADPGSAHFTLSALLCAATAGLLVWAARHRPLLAFGVAVFGIGLLPVLGLVPMKLLILEHRSYVPLLGLALAVGAWVASARSRVVPAAVAAGLVAFAALTQAHVASFRDAEALWSNAVRRAPESIYAQSEWGQTLGKLDRSEEGIPYLRRVLAARPYLWHVRFNLSIALEDTGRRAEALRQLEWIIEREPGYWRAHRYLGVLHLREGRLEEAHGPLLRAAELRPDDPDMLEPLGRLYETQKRWPEAIRAYARATELAPRSAVAWERLARAYNNSHDYPRAVAAYRRALALDPDSGSIHFGLGAALLVTGPREQAQAHARRAAELGYDDPRLLEKLRQRAAADSRRSGAAGQGAGEGSAGASGGSAGSSRAARSSSSR